MKHLTEEEKELIWKFCYYLQNNPRALMKFVKSVDWNQPKQVKHATALLEKWAKPKVYKSISLWKIAWIHVNRLFLDWWRIRVAVASISARTSTKRYSGEILRTSAWWGKECEISFFENVTYSYCFQELSYYLLSLVQALRYDRYDAQSTENSSLLNFLIKRSQANFKIANDLFWFLDVEAMKINDVADYSKKRGEFLLGMFKVSDLPN